jgi:hypothetical protein
MMKKKQVYIEINRLAEKISVPDIQEKILSKSKLSDPLPSMVSHKINIPFKRIAFSAASILVFLFVVLLSFQSFSDKNFNKLNSETSSKEINTDSSKPTPLICAAYIDSNNFSNASLYSRNKKYISSMLSSKINEYKGKNVYFRVKVQFISTGEDGEDCENNYSLNGMTYKSIYSEYLKYSDEFIKGKISRDEYDNKSSIFHEKREQLYQAYSDELFNNKMSYVKSLNISNIEPVTDTADFRKLNHEFYMDLSEDMINSLANKGGFIFTLALPKRDDGFNKTISDSLISCMKNVKSNDKIHVLAITVYDHNNTSAFNKNILYNADYNSDMNKVWNRELNKENIEEFINNILSRNNITNKLNTDFSIYSFVTKLTPDEIQSLSKDNDIKVLYPISDNVLDHEGFINH